jgi:hypothetical protein
MQPFAACRLKLQRLRGRIIAKHCCRRHLTAQKPHALAVLQVDGRVKDHRSAPISMALH